MQDKRATPSGLLLSWEEAPCMKLTQMPSFRHDFAQTLTKVPFCVVQTSSLQPVVQRALCWS